MGEFEDNKEIYQKSIRGTYIIFPLKYDRTQKLQTLNIDDSEELDFISQDWSDLLIKKCRKDGNFVRRFILNEKIDDIKYDDKPDIMVDEVQLVVFNNGIAFLSVLLVYENAQTSCVYDIINPGYLENKNRELCNNVIKYLKKISVQEEKDIFRVYASSNELAIKETYLLNAAIVGKRFHSLETMEKAAFNAHKIIELSRIFEDKSETDIAYTYGARDVQVETYRWCACISSQSISYVYAVENQSEWNADTIKDASKEDLLMTILVLYQKSTCMLLNEEIQNAISNRKKRHFFKNVMELKKQALEFRALGTVAPSQVSRWNNVCETYRYLLDVNGVNEALEEIEQKIDLIKDEQERKSSQIQGYIATVIAIFGLISIIASVLTIVDLIDGGSKDMITALAGSCVGIILFVVSWLVMMVRRK